MCHANISSSGSSHISKLNSAPIKIHFDLKMDVFKKCISSYSSFYETTRSFSIKGQKNCLKLLDLNALCSSNATTRKMVLPKCYELATTRSTFRAIWNGHSKWMFAKRRNALSSVPSWAWRRPPHTAKKPSNQMMILTFLCFCVSSSFKRWKLLWSLLISQSKAQYIINALFFKKNAPTFQS